MRLPMPHGGKVVPQLIQRRGDAPGVSGRTLDKATAVVEAAESDPEKFGHLILDHYGMP